MPPAAKEAQDQKKGGQPAAKEGLQDIIAGHTAICHVFGGDKEKDEPGRLIYRGYDIDDLAKHSTFEEVVFLLWNTDLPNKQQLDELKKQLAANRMLPAPVIELLRRFPTTATPMDVIRSTVSTMGLFDPEGAVDTPEANRNKALRLTAQMPSIVATWHRLRQGKEPIAAKPGQTTAEAFLYMLNGEEPTDVAVRTLDVALILHADHEFNASTFAARVTAATLSDMHSAVTSAVGALIGPLHGGANEGVIHTLQKIGEVDKVESFVMDLFKDRTKRIMGFGHRVYRSTDPRATHLREMSQELGKRNGDLKFWEMSRKMEDVVWREKKLNANVDFYSASTYWALGLPTDLFTPVFAVSRIAGWTAHILEQYSDNRIIRPLAEYMGDWERDYVPIDKRDGQQAKQTQPAQQKG
ncbi:MAG TPA: citrate synthase [Chloroflexota bacterium]|nr:citrate synthase [Chloroflexota bacterium]